MFDIEKYSKINFERIKHDPAALKKLLDQLQIDVAIECKGVILTKMKEIVQELNLTGHQLNDNDFEEPEETDFCEFHDDDESETCGFRLGTYFTVCTGYYKLEEIDY